MALKIYKLANSSLDKVSFWMLRLVNVLSVECERRIKDVEGDSGHPSSSKPMLSGLRAHVDDNRSSAQPKPIDELTGETDPSYGQFESNSHGLCSP